MVNEQIFFDPQRKRWKRLRRIFDICAVAVTLVVAVFIFNVFLSRPLPQLLLPEPSHNYKAVPDRNISQRNAKGARPARRSTQRRPSEIPLNSGEGLRAAYYAQSDAGSISSLKEHIQQIDILFPDWLHVSAQSGELMAMSSDNLSEYPVVEDSGVRDPDILNKVKNVVQHAHVDTEIYPQAGNYNPHTLSWDKGVPLQFVSIGRWRWETADADAAVTCKVYKNDKIEAPLGTLTLAPGTEQEVTAAF